MARPRLAYYSFDSQGNPWVSGGGALRDAQVLARFARNWDVTLYVGRYPGFRPAPIAGVRVVGLGFGASNAVCRLAFSLSANLRLLCDTSDAIGNSLSAFAPLPAALLRRKRCYAVLHHKVGGEAVKKYGWAGFLPRALESLLLRGLRHFIVSNRATAEKIRAVNASGNILVTSNSVDSVLLDTEPREADPPYILFLGRFDIHMKGIDILMEAYARAAAEGGAGPDLVLAGAASPEAMRAVAALVPPGLASRIRLQPNVSDAEKRGLLSGCLFFCSPSRFEGFGIAALEANACGKAALVSDADGFRDSVNAPETGLMVPRGDVAALADGLRELLADGGKRRAMGQAGRDWARGFQWDAIAAKEMHFVASLAGTGVVSGAGLR